MDNSILVWKYLYPFLKNNTELNKYIDGRIYPLIANSDTKFPYVLFRRDSVSPNYTKLPYGGWDNIVTISVGVYTKRDPGDYFTGIEILNIIRSIFEQKCLITDEIKIEEIKVSDVSEGVQNEDNYLQSISFTLSVTSNTNL